MKKKFLSIFLTAFLGVSGYAAEKSSQAIVRTPTGLEWLERSMGERLNDVVVSMTLLNQSGVPLAQAPEDYYDAIDTRLRRNPAFYTTDLTELLANHLYEKEPAAREALDHLKRPKEKAEPGE